MIQTKKPMTKIASPPRAKAVAKAKKPTKGAMRHSNPHSRSRVFWSYHCSPLNPPALQSSYSYPMYPVRSWSYNYPYAVHSPNPVPVPVTPGSHSPAGFSDPSQFNRKRQRRQAAGVVVQSLFSGGDGDSNANMGRKSTAQPRPVLNVPPRGIGPISDPNENDVLSGRGGRINSHPGNVQFRDVIAVMKKEYLAPTTKKLEKAHIAASIVNDIRSMNPPGRFLKADSDTGMWWDIGDAKAIKKTGQALREDAPEIREDIDSGDEKDGDGAAKKPSKAATKRPKSPKPLQQQPTITAQIPIPPSTFAQGMVAGPQHVPGPSGWQQQQMDYQAQAAMPPPFAQQQQMIPSQGYAQGMASIPTQLYGAGRSVGGGVSSASKYAMEALGLTPNRRISKDDVAFGRTFHPPPVLNSEANMSEISGLSDPMSNLSSPPVSSISGLSRGSARSGQQKMGMMAFGTSARRTKGAPLSQDSSPTSLRFNQLGRRAAPGALGSSRMSELTMASSGGLSRSLSFPDMSSMLSGSDNELYNKIMESSDEVMEGASVTSGRSGGRMSMMSIGSGSSSARWMAANLREMDDGQSYLSQMSSELNALDLA